MWTWGAAGAAAVVAGIAWWAVARRRAGYRYRLRKALLAHGDALLRDLVIPDGMDGQIHVSHVLRSHAGFVVVDVIPAAGAVFGAAAIDEWTVMHGRRSHKFRNPVAGNRARVLAVRSLVPGVPVHGLVVLLGPVTFPKGVPEETVTVDTLGAALDALPATTARTEQWDDGWYGLVACRVKPR
jgi:hypothetical protein